MKKLTLTLLMLLMAATVNASVIDAPHNETNDITCNSCHTYSLWWRYSPSGQDPSQHVSTVDNLCLTCHYEGSQRPFVKPHSSTGMGEYYDPTALDALAPWYTTCTECHDPHFQSQLAWLTTEPNNVYLVTGSISAWEQSDVGTTSFQINNGTTSFKYLDSVEKPLVAKPGWESPSLWSKKTGEDGQGRGLILVVSRELGENTFEINSVDETNQIITVQGEIPSTFDEANFGIIYGGLIRDEIRGTSGIKFFDPLNGAFVDSENNKGLCQVCHTQTDHFKNNDSPTVVVNDHKDKSDSNGNSGSSSRCTSCHFHMVGFAGAMGGGQHPIHIAAGAVCDDCHSAGTPDPLTSPVCAVCHNDGISINGTPNVTDYRQNWDNPAYNISCDGCHNGRPNNPEDLLTDPVDGHKLVMATGGHDRLVGESWVRRYPCSYCHYDTVNTDGVLTANHTNGIVDVAIDPQWKIVGENPPVYNQQTSTCSNLYCHSDGTTVSPEMREYRWNDGHKDCNACHGHAPAANECSSCHEDGRVWSDEEKWLSAMPMYPNTGPGTARANSHFRHLFTGFSCDDCHFKTVKGGECLVCHDGTIVSETGSMSEQAHIDGNYHVNKIKDVNFKDGGIYNSLEKSCSSTACHTGGNDQYWGDSVNDGVVCLDCHGTTGADVDDFGAFNDVRAKISQSQWSSRGHGKPAGSGNYSQSGNPPANFTNNGCWYCHDNKILHQDDNNPFRLRQHEQFSDRFEKECVYCHMEGKDSECLTCHNDAESLAPQLGTIADHNTYVDGLTSCVSACHLDDANIHKTNAGLWPKSQKEDVKNSYLMMGVCLKCHDDDAGNGCTSCHTAPADDPLTADIDESQKYALGFDPDLPGLGFIKPQQAKASSFHFGYKHYLDYEASIGNDLVTGLATESESASNELTDTSKVWTDNQWKGYAVKITSGASVDEILRIKNNTGDTLILEKELIAPIQAGDGYSLVDPVWKGGKFCWDCHDPHGDGNIYMIQNKVATRTDGVNGKPIDRATVSFTRKIDGGDYARTSAPYDGLCNVCHSEGSKHYTKVAGDGHQKGRVCTTCHEHRFTDSHSSGKACNSCHQSKPVPRHTGFSQPRDCTKCHEGVIAKRMDVMGQFRANSHHVQGVAVENTHCYTCHWEATEDGLINIEHHEGYNYKTHETAPNAKVDLVIWGPGVRPTAYDADGLDDNDTATTFLAANISGTLAQERQEVENTTPHCLGCHSDQNNNTQPFNDCKTPRQYAWDTSSVASRYTNTGTTPWGKYTAKITKALSSHGNAKQNGGGYSTSTGIDGSVPNTRAGNYNVQCFDCHSSHGSYVAGTTSNYTTFNGTKNGGNLKETQAGKGGYEKTYKAKSNIGSPDPNQYAAGAGQCFDCHETMTKGDTPWGYNSTFGATAPIMGYYDTLRFGPGTNGSEARFPYKARANHMGHYGVSAPLQNAAKGEINGLCTPCHDPHGVSLALGADMAYAVPSLTGTWLTTPYKEDAAATAPGLTAVGYGGKGGLVGKTPKFDVPSASARLTQTEKQFAGLCLKCHPQSTLDSDSTTTWASSDRIHDTVQGWGSNRHSFSCSKCHTPHANELPRLLVTNCLNGSHAGQVASGGITSGSGSGSGTKGSGSGSGNWNGGSGSQKTGSGGRSYTYTGGAQGCHPARTNKSWNNVSPW